ncbi:hypothetical protein NPIL_405341 [Nephila pilipes]|uniref:Secreted protein n=1 Tax=Nephila pilipes TaxID=299642 RepID=A0A8X6UPB6_NEPPI|nr:hypothetical protein NPIL_405341 [Nephila pilipes]
MVGLKVSFILLVSATSKAEQESLLINLERIWLKFSEQEKSGKRFPSKEGDLAAPTVGAAAFTHTCTRCRGGRFHSSTAKGKSTLLAERPSVGGLSTFARAVAARVRGICY